MNIVLLNGRIVKLPSSYVCLYLLTVTLSILGRVVFIAGGSDKRLVTSQRTENKGL